MDEERERTRRFLRDKFWWLAPPPRTVHPRPDDVPEGYASPPEQGGETTDKKARPGDFIFGDDVTPHK